MSEPLFLQIHTLTSYPGVLINRDDAGFAKRLPFGGSVRTRISSQCLKYHWRNHEGLHSLSDMEVPHSVRSRITFGQLVARPLIEEGFPAPLVGAFARAVQDVLLSGKALTKNEFKKVLEAKEVDAVFEHLKSGQVTILGRPEVDYVITLLREKLESLKHSVGDITSTGADKLVETAYELISFKKDMADLKKNLRALRQASGLEAALFGRMVTSDMLARGDAAIHVAHAFTTHAEEAESDYFSAVDELLTGEDGGELGSGHINSQELTSGLYYGYVVVDVPLLVSNLEGIRADKWQTADRTLAAEVIKKLIPLIATVSPGAKLGSTAPHAWAQMVMVEASAAQPRTLANAFQRAVSTNGHGVLNNSYEALAGYVEETDRMYGHIGERRLAAMASPADFASRLNVEGFASVPDIAAWAAQRVAGGA